MGGSASFIEVTWTIVATLGLLFSMWLVADGYTDWEYLQEAIRARPPRARRLGPRWWAGLSAIVANSLLCVPWSLFVGLGAIAMIYPPPPPTAQQQISVNWFGILFIVAEVFLAGVQAWHLFVRRKIEQADPWRPRSPTRSLRRSSDTVTAYTGPRPRQDRGQGQSRP